MDSDMLLRQEETHNVEFEVRLVIDGETVKKMSSPDFEVISSYAAEAELTEALNEYLTDELVASQDDYYDRHSEDIQ